jgi:hypothetical protein
MATATETKQPTEGELLDSTSGEEAKAILCQLGWFASDTHFLSLRLTDAEFNHVQEACAIYPRLTTEAVISALCEQGVLGKEGGSV